ncbi:MAG TPA: hypothetical protein VMW10_04665 [Alphaproteobacteria bacterium]|nr:hypothetical protein [Alphaproteobacteria bacterium]
MPRGYQKFELDRQAVRQFMVEAKSFWIATHPLGAREACPRKNGGRRYETSTSRLCEELCSEAIQNYL